MQVKKIAIRALSLSLMLAAAHSVFAQREVADSAMKRDSAAVQRLLKAGADVNGAQADGATALHWAAYNGDVELTRVLLKAGAKTGVANRNGSTPLWLAASRGDAGVIAELLKGGANPNEELPLGRKPLMLAARAGSVDAVRTLVEKGADVNARESQRGTTALMQAADQGHADVVVELIKHGANVAAVSAPVMRDGRTAALGNSGDPRRAVRQQYIGVLCDSPTPDFKVIQDMLDSLGIRTDKSKPASKDSLCANVRRAGLGFVQVSGAGGLAGGGAGATDSSDVPASPEGANNDAQLSDQAAAEAAANARRGRRPPPREPDGGELTALVYAARSGAIEAAEVLLKAGANVNQTTRYGWSPLLAATQNQNYQMAKFLIEHGADVNLANKGGWTPLYLATDNRNIEGGDYPTRTADMDSLEFIKYLLDKGAQVNARISESTETRTVFTNQWLDEEGATAFLRASQSGDLELMKLLVDRGADPRINTKLGVTPLAAAAGIGWVEGVTKEWSTKQTVEAVKFLLKLGVDPNFQADTGRTALHGAGHKGATEVAKLLVEAGAKLDVRDFGNTDNRGSPELASHTWLPIDYADGLVRVGVQSAIPHPETAKFLREAMLKAGLKAPPEGRTIESICIVEVCSKGYDPLKIN